MEIETIIRILFLPGLILGLPAFGLLLKRIRPSIAEKGRFRGE